MSGQKRTAQSAAPKPLPGSLFPPSAEEPPGTPRAASPMRRGRSLGLLGTVIAAAAMWMEGCAPGPAADPHRVCLRSRSFVPSAGVETALRGRIEAALRREEVRHAYVQLKAGPTPVLRADLAAAGVKLLDYVGGRTWEAALSDANTLRFGNAAVRAQRPALAHVRWIGEILSEDKLSPQVRRGRIGKSARRPDGRVELSVSHFADVDPADVRKVLEKHGAETISHAPAVQTFLVAVDENRIAHLADDDRIRWIEAVPPPGEPEADRVRAYVQADAAHAAGWTGDGVTVGVLEGGHVTDTHPDLAGRVTRGDSDPWDRGQHVTMVGGMIAGSGAQSGAYGGTANQWRGIAPDAHLYTYDFYVGTSPTTAQQHANYLGDLQTAINTHHVDVANNSWGAVGCAEFPYGQYGGLCDDLDAAVRGDSYDGPVILVFSGGNERDGYWSGDVNQTDCLSATSAPFANYDTINHPKTAKNVLAVGGIDSANNRMSTYSSWGPTDDGRIKPEIVAAGHHNGHLVSNVSEVDNPYGDPVGSANQQDYRTPGHPHPPAANSWMYHWFGLTSCAAATTSGCIAQLVEAWRDEFKTEINPLPATVRALLVHSAQDLDDATTWYNPGPDYASGYGLLRINTAIGLLGGGHTLEGKLAGAAAQQYTVSVPAGTTSLRVTLAWDDPPPAPAAAAALVNDLDLIVRDPGGNRYYPWTLNPSQPANNAVRTQEDHANNLEQVLVDADLVSGSTLPAGTWTVEVDANFLPEGPQRYALVCDRPLVGTVDVVQVLDRSGSMGGKASPTMVDTKIQVLREAATQFIDVMKPGIGNRLGLAQFNQDVVAFPPGSQEALAELTATRAALLKTTTVPSITHGGLTSIGDGLQEALTQFAAAPAAPGHRRSVLLVSDGKENMPLWIADVQSSLDSNGIAVYCLGLGYGSGINEAKLTDLSGATGGTYRITADHLVFKKLFLEALAGAVDWSLISDPIGELSRGETATVPFSVAGDEHGVTATVAWEGTEHAVSLVLRTPSGERVTPKTPNRWVRWGSGPRYRFCQLDFPLAGELAGEWAGTWQMVLASTGALDAGQSVRYTTSAYAEGGAGLQVDFGKPPYLTGRPVVVRARVLRDGRDVGAKQVHVVGSMPAVSVANVLHDHKVSADELQKVRPADGDPLSLADKKLQVLMRNAGPDLLPRKQAKLTLHDDGLHNDGAARDGVYANVLTGARISGTYTFRVRVDGIPAGGERTTTREWSGAFHVAPHVLAEHSRLATRLVQKTPQGPKVEARVVPKDAFGNFLGPGHDVRVAFGRGGKQDVPLTDNVDGTYSGEFVVPPRAVPPEITLTVSIDGKDFAKLPVPR